MIYSGLRQKPQPAVFCAIVVVYARQSAADESVSRAVFLLSQYS